MPTPPLPMICAFCPIVTVADASLASTLTGKAVKFVTMSCRGAMTKFCTRFDAPTIVWNVRSSACAIR